MFRDVILDPIGDPDLTHLFPLAKGDEGWLWIPACAGMTSDV
jgi:hypothetical protein